MFQKALILSLALMCCVAGPIFAQAGGITRLGASTFILRDPGFYQVNFQVPVEEAAQLQLRLNGQRLASSTVGRATGRTQIIGFNIIQTTELNSVLELINPSTDTAISISQGSPENPLSAHLLILRLR